LLKSTQGRSGQLVSTYTWVPLSTFITSSSLLLFDVD
jgi:hypothetical protein